MTNTNKEAHSIDQNGIEADSRIPSEAIVDIPNSEQGNKGDISSVISRVYEPGGSVASDVSGLTDGDFFKTDDSSTPFETLSNTKKNCRSVTAPTPPLVSPTKLTDIQSESTATTNSSSRDEKPAKKKRRSVSFCEVEIRRYERILEINPCVTSGPAVGIGWVYSPVVESFPLEIFEKTREYLRCSSTDELTISRHEREDLLRSWGYTQREIACSVRTILRTKNQRKQTVQNLHASSVEEFMENATRKMKHVLLFPLNPLRRSKSLGHSPRAHRTSKNFESSVLRKTSLIQPSAA